MISAWWIPPWLAHIRMVKSTIKECVFLRYSCSARPHKISFPDRNNGSLDGLGFHWTSHQKGAVTAWQAKQ